MENNQYFERIKGECGVSFKLFCQEMPLGR